VAPHVQPRFTLQTHHRFQALFSLTLTRFVVRTQSLVPVNIIPAI
jgi:hypothetical protein